LEYVSPSHSKPIQPNDFFSGDSHEDAKVDEDFQHPVYRDPFDDQDTIDLEEIP